MRSRFTKSHGSTVSFFAFQDVITGTTGFLIIITIFLALNLDEVIGKASTTADPNTTLAATLKTTLEQIAKLKDKTAVITPAPSETEETVRRMIAELRNSIARLTPTASTPVIPAEERPVDREIRIEKQKLLTIIESLKKLLPTTTKEATDAESKVASMESERKKAQSQFQESSDQQDVIYLIPEKSATSKNPVLVTVASSGFRIQAFDDSEARKADSLEGLMQTLFSAYPANGHYIVFYFKPSAVLQFNEVTRRTRGAGYEIGYDLIPEHIQLQPARERTKRQPATTPP
ncbi:hypothetical protein [Prosthecobacter vanneervenii]|uniref:Uncharacterized protein n=1 Tax=Prosthecobacter vanneervenii TaxID=48466 RepID=A0A7W8DKT8_9BACT|nr:hypothetical protein [Prosthecobacter vanneervenii]MBB5033558.1 hypothetical protein [Prosthecobacter vanneervenii]